MVNLKKESNLQAAEVPSNLTRLKVAIKDFIRKYPQGLHY